MRIWAVCKKNHRLSYDDGHYDDSMYSSMYGGVISVIAIT